ASRGRCRPQPPPDRSVPPCRAPITPELSLDGVQGGFGGGEGLCLGIGYLLAYLVVDRVQGRLGHTIGHQASPVGGNRVAGKPGRHFLGRPVLARIGPRVTAMPVRDSLDEDWTAAGSGTVDCRRRRGVDPLD